MITKPLTIQQIIDKLMEVEDKGQYLTICINNEEDIKSFDSHTYIQVREIEINSSGLGYWDIYVY